MNYIAIKDLKKTRMVRELLDSERELVLTCDGRPFAMLVGISPDNIEESLKEIRRAMFSVAVSRTRRRISGNTISEEDIQKEITASRKERGIK